MPYARTFPRRRRTFAGRYARRSRRNFWRRGRQRELAILFIIAVALLLIALVSSR